MALEDRNAAAPFHYLGSPTGCPQGKEDDMEEFTVKDIMVPLSEYATCSSEATLYEARDGAREGPGGIP